MKSAFVMLAISGLISTSTWAAKLTDMDGAKTPNGKVVVGFIETLFNEHRGEAAFDKYVGKTYRDHGNLAVMNGVQGASGMAGAPQQDASKNDFERGRVGEARMVESNPKIHFDIKKVLVQGELVFVQAHGTNGQSANGDLMWMLYRVENGKITEHWDTHGEIPNNQVDKQW